MAHPFIVRYPDRRKRPAAWRTAPLRDLSVGGARFLCECRFHVGEIITLELVLPVAPKPVPIAARIVWVKPVLLPMGLLEYGVEFRHVPPLVQRLLEDAVAPFLER